MSPEKSVQSIDNNSSKTLPPEIEALRLAALSTRKTSKEKQKSENSNLPVPSSPPPKSFYTEDDSSEREEGELSDTDSIDDNKKLQLPQPTLQNPVQNVMEDITYNTNNNQQITIKMSKAEMEETTRQSISKLYNYGATPDDLIQEGIPLDVVVRFSRELNYPLPPHLFNIKIPGYPLSMPRQMEIDQPMTISNITAAAAVIQEAASNNSNLKGSSSILPSKT
nr:8105_t:CDS:2 [Entrophospora candida]CAG8616875.1 4407_t:CDS:2 [Entrophospora candida]